MTSTNLQKHVVLTTEQYEARRQAGTLVTGIIYDIRDYVPSGIIPLSDEVAWGCETSAGEVTPDLTLPDVPTPRTEATELIYIFTAATASADFYPPEDYILGDEDGFIDMEAGDGISYTDLTVGSIYEISFKVLDSTHIALLKKEYKTQ